MKFGLSEETFILLLNYFKAHPEIIKVIIYGSRAMGRQQRGSDIDLAIITTKDEDISAKIKSDLEELPTPYLFDVTDYHHITNASLKQHIDRVGKVIYE